MNKPLMEHRLTTNDNPYDPFDQFDNWYLFDETKGYCSSSYLGRIAKTSSMLTDYENAELIEKAIDDIVRLDFMNIYKKVSREVSKIKIEF